MRAAMAFVNDFKEEFTAAVTPELKKAVCDSARILAKELFKGFWLKFVLVIISILESTIKI